MNKWFAVGLCITLGACTAAQVQTANTTITKACAGYDKAKAAVGTVSLPAGVMKAVTVIEKYVDPVCDGPSGPVEIDSNTVSWVLQNIGGIGALIGLKL